jgi:YVTN family beta-propeller protein
MKNNWLNRFFTGLLLTGSTLAFTACEKTPEVAPKWEYERGIFVVNEGNFGQPNGAISYFNPTTEAVEPNVFNKVNNRPLGDVVQSMTVHGEKAFIVANNSNKVEVVDANTFASLGVIEGLALPRYFTGHNNKGYVTEWVGFSGNGRVALIDLATNTVTKTIPVGKMPERLLLAQNGKLYVANSGDNTLSVINPATDAVEATLTVGDSPTSLAQDAANNIWVLNFGKVVYKEDWSVDYDQTTAGSLVRFNPASPAALTTLPFASNRNRPDHLQLNGQKNRLYYIYAGQVFEMNTTATALPASPLIDRNFSGLGVDPTDNIIYGADAGNFSVRGQVFRYSSTGQPLGSFQADIGPKRFVFRR